MAHANEPTTSRMRYMPYGSEPRFSFTGISQTSTGAAPAAVSTAVFAPLATTTIHEVNV